MTPAKRRRPAVGFRPVWLGVLVAIAAAGCNALFGVDDLSYEGAGAAAAGSPTTSGGGATSSTTSGGGATSSTTSSGAAGSTTTSMTTSTSGVAGEGGQGAGGGSGGAGGVPPISCDDQYGDLSGYLLCRETSSECDIDAPLGAMSCGDLCELGGGMCLHASPSDGACNDGGYGIPCSIAGPDPIMCTCSRGCAGDLPCVAPDVCSSSGCQD